MDRDDHLDGLFQAARDDAPPPSDRLMQAILRDAADAMPAQAAPSARPARAGWPHRFLEGVGGWPSIAALAVSACFGLWLGYAAPQSAYLLDGNHSVTSDVSGLENALYSDIDDLLMEG